ncbi:DNA-binding transcriptional ArsR family regulator [Geodermatophilus bullaregiensis]|uniref:helix-turn-helix domain-containing protein n=1 Tax=Geodermatophilus bullaregiensis TaxID=1564160 RepID=UPI00195A482D|nr:helix-turn-helix domain-containing protein [Geodermatophilus bullaregiensis]MBM7807863.1 DNA-binding transcriptional ArsR family regulator [Geodermatophilus bullaregiensis]
MHEEVPPTPAVDVHDARTLRALAHPLRATLLGLLRAEGPSTASKLGQRLGESSGSTSYHLRQLAGFGLVEEVPGEGTGRERWWRALHRSTRWQTEEVVTQPGGREVVEELTHQSLATQRRLLAAHAEQREGLEEVWRDATSLNDWALHLSPEGARALLDELNGVVERWRTEREEPGQPLVHVLVDLFRLAEYPS